MALQLKENFLIEIFRPSELNKCSKSLLNINTIIKLEKNEGFELPKDLIKDIEKLQKKENNFINNIPLKTIEHYLNTNSTLSLNSFIYIRYKDQELNLQKSEYLNLIDTFYNDLFVIASMLADYYNLEIKIKTNSKINDEMA